MNTNGTGNRDMASLDEEFGSTVYPAELAALRTRAAARTRSTGRPGSLPDFDAHFHAGRDKERSAFLSRTLALLNDSDQENLWRTWSEQSPDQRHAGLTGLALSGGGIRSSTINLGILQVLDRVGLFKCFDYLSTVSGGGYVGSSLSTCFAEPSAKQAHPDDSAADSPAAGDPLAASDAAFPYRHVPGEPEPPAFVQLRDFSNFLVPRGLIDYLRFPVLLIRGVLINFLVVLPWIIGAALVSAWLMTRMVGAEGREQVAWLWTARLSGAVPTPLAQFPLTFAFAALFAALALLFPVARKYQAPGLGHETLRRLSNASERVMVVALAALAVGFVIDAQPFAIRWLGTLNGAYTQPSLAAGLTAVSAILASFGKVFIEQAAKILGRYALYLISLVGVAAFWTIYLAWCRALLLATPTTDFTQLGNPWIWSTIALGVLIVYTNAFVDANGLSLHNFYRDRIAKAFLFRVDRSTNRVQSLLDLPLTRLSPVNGPLHIVNTTLNTREFPERFRKGRHGEPFFFSSLFTGSRLTGYCRTAELEKQQGDVTLSTAIATSGAAFSSNMGTQTSVPLRFIASMLNLRLGYWLLNPRLAKPGTGWRARSGGLIGVGVLRFLQELVGRLSYSSSYVYLSDGGHIENLGLYELVRRQCRFIVVGDGEADPHYTFHGLTEAMRLIRVDFGVQIEMDGLDEIRSGEQQYARGTIYYPGDRRGYLIYLKSSLLGDDMIESTVSPGGYITSPLRRDVRHFDELGFIAQYKSKHPAFPQESTADQFFDEQQFEAYRSLGYLIADRALTAST